MEENNASSHGDKCGCILCRNGARFLDTAMIEESLVLLPVTVLEAVIGIFAGYRLGLKENRRAYWIGGALLLLASFDVILHYYM